MSKAIPHNEVHSAIDVVKLSGADIDCMALWGAPAVAVQVLGTAGNVVLTKCDDTDITIAVPSGVRLDVQFQKLKFSGTTATEVIVYCNRIRNVR